MSVINLSSLLPLIQQFELDWWRFTGDKVARNPVGQRGWTSAFREMYEFYHVSKLTETPCKYLFDELHVGNQHVFGKLFLTKNNLLNSVSEAGMSHADSLAVCILSIAFKSFDIKVLLMYTCINWCVCVHTMHIYLGGDFNHFYVNPYLGKIPNLANMFQGGWNQ